jgi:hypothetical protein
MNARTNKGIGTQLISLVGGAITICGVTLCSVPMAQPTVHASLSPAVSSTKAVMTQTKRVQTERMRVCLDAPMIAMANNIKGEDR